MQSPWANAEAPDTTREIYDTISCMAIEQWWILKYLAAGAYIAIMLAVLGVPQLLSSYFDIRERRRERAEAAANAERLHQEAERRREETERRRDERHHEMMTMLAAIASNATNQSQGQEQSEVIRAQRQIIERLTAENERLRNGRDDSGERQ